MKDLHRVIQYVEMQDAEVSLEGLWMVQRTKSM